MQGRGERVFGLVREALERTLEALEGLGRLEQVDCALVALCRSTASTVDESPGRASIVKEYRDCLVTLYARTAGDGGDGLGELMAELAGASVCDKTPAG